MNKKDIGNKLFGNLASVYIWLFEGGREMFMELLCELLAIVSFVQNHSVLAITAAE